MGFCGLAEESFTTVACLRLEEVGVSIHQKANSIQLANELADGGFTLAGPA